MWMGGCLKCMGDHLPVLHATHLMIMIKANAGTCKLTWTTAIVGDETAHGDCPPRVHMALEYCLSMLRLMARCWILDGFMKNHRLICGAPMEGDYCAELSKVHLI